MITYLEEYDLTGSNPDYLRDDRRFKVFTTGQEIDFEEAAYANTIQVYLVASDGTKSSLIQGTKWNVDYTDTDITSMSKAKVRYMYAYNLTEDTVFAEDKDYYVIDSSTNKYELAIVITGGSISTDMYYERTEASGTWDYTLVRGIYMMDSITPDPEYEIQVTYQAFELDMPSLKRDSHGPEYSPGLMRSVLLKIEELYNVRNPVTDTAATAVSGYTVMEEDLTGISADNYVEDEEHIVSVTENKFVIRPQNGSFYNNSGLIVKYGDVVLDSSVYDVIGINKEKTAISEPTCGVYEYIVLKKDYTGTISISYQAFGGDVSVSDINVLKEYIQNIYQLLDSTSLVTADNINSLDIIQQIIYRQDLLEDTFSHYQKQQFVYNTTGASITTGTSSDKWANIAFIENSPWSDDAGVDPAGLGEFRIEIPVFDYFLDMRLTYDSNSSTKLKISTCHVVAPVYEEYGLSYFDKRMLPKFRLIWMKDNLDGYEATGIDNGIMLQMSMTSLTATKCTVSIEDRTSAKSPWTLTDTLGELRPDGYTNLKVTFPNDVAWNYSDGVVTDEIALYAQGYTVFVGSIPVSELDTVTHYGYETGELPDVDNLADTVVDTTISGTDLDVTYIDAMEVVMYDRVTGQNITARSQSVSRVSTDTQNTVTCDIMYYIDDLCSISVTLVYDNTTSTYTLQLNTHTGSNSLNSDRFSLVRIDVIN